MLLVGGAQLSILKHTKIIRREMVMVEVRKSLLY